MCLSMGQGMGYSETPVRKGFGDHMRVGMVIGGKTPERLPVLFVSCPEPSWGDLCPAVETYQHREEARQVSPRTPLPVYPSWVRLVLG